MKIEFNLNRFIALLKREFFVSQQKLLLGLIINMVFGGFIFLLPQSGMTNIYFFALLFVASAMAFNLYIQKLSEEQQLLLPVSNFERFLAVFVRSFIAIPLMIIIALIPGVLIMGLLSNILPDYIMPACSMQDIFDGIGRIFTAFWYIFSNYYSIFALFFFGSIFYRRYSYFKMAILMFGIAVFTLILVALVFLIMSKTFLTGNEAYHMSYYSHIVEIVGTIIGMLYSVFFVFLAYLRLTEREDK
jgi:hypothetical protein